MIRRRKPTAALPQPALFAPPGPPPPLRPGARGTMELALFVHRRLEDSWLVSPTGVERDAKPAPVSLAIGKVEIEPGQWAALTLPVWLARDRGWAP